MTQAGVRSADLHAGAAVSIAALVLLCSAPSLADTAPAMTLQQAVDFALAHNARVLQARANAAQAGAVLARDRAATLPIASGILQSQLNKQTPNNSGTFAQIGANVSPNFSQNTAALQGTFDGLNLTNIYQARTDKRSYDESQQNLRLASEQATLDVETAFYKVVQLIQLTEIAREDVAYNRALMAIAEVNYQGGKIAGIDQLKAQVAYTSALEQLTSADADEVDGRENLAQLIGAPMDQQFALPPEPPEPPLPSLDKKALDALALANRPEVAVSQSLLEAAYIAYHLVDAPNRPNLSLQAAWGNLVSPTNRAALYDECVAHGFPPPECLPGRTHFYEIAITSTWTLPLLDWGTVHAGHGAASRLIDEQTQALTTARQQALVDVDQAVRRLLVTRDNLALASANVSVAKQAALISAVQYKAGLATVTDVQAAQQSYLSVARDHLTAQVDYVLALAKLKLATGTLTGAI